MYGSGAESCLRASAALASGRSTVSTIQGAKVLAVLKRRLAGRLTYAPSVCALVPRLLRRWSRVSVLPQHRFGTLHPPCRIVCLFVCLSTSALWSWRCCSLSLIQISSSTTRSENAARVRDTGWGQTCVCGLGTTLLRTDVRTSMQQPHRKGSGRGKQKTQEKLRPAKRKVPHLSRASPYPSARRGKRNSPATLLTQQQPYTRHQPPPVWQLLGNQRIKT
jgi:hypothetical protein